MEHDVLVQADGVNTEQVPQVVTDRLHQDQRAWMSTLRVRDGSPHVTPVWFVYDPGCWWVSADANSVKVRNLEQDPRVSFALEGGRDPVVAEGTARIHYADFPNVIVRQFAAKYAGWDIRTNGGAPANRVLIEVTQTRWLLLGSAQ